VVGSCYLVLFLCIVVREFYVLSKCSMCSFCQLSI
jgi:hypothetical protein